MNDEDKPEEGTGNEPESDSALPPELQKIVDDAAASADKILSDLKESLDTMMEETVDKLCEIVTRDEVPEDRERKKQEVKRKFQKAREDADREARGEEDEERPRTNEALVSYLILVALILGALALVVLVAR